MNNRELSVTDIPSAQQLVALGVLSILIIVTEVNQGLGKIGILAISETLVWHCVGSSRPHNQRLSRYK